MWGRGREGGTGRGEGGNGEGEGAIEVLDSNLWKSQRL